MDEQIKKLAEQYGIDLAKSAGRKFAEWLSTRPRVAKLPRLAKLLYKLSRMGV